MPWAAILIRAIHATDNPLYHQPKNYHLLVSSPIVAATYSSLLSLNYVDVFGGAVQSCLAELYKYDLIYIRDMLAVPCLDLL